MKKLIIFLGIFVFIFSTGVVFANNGNNYDDVSGNECEQGEHVNNPHCQPTETPELSITPTEEEVSPTPEEVSPTITPELTIEPTEEVVPSVTPVVDDSETPTPTATNTPSPTATPSNSGNSSQGDGRSDGLSDGKHQEPDGLGCAVHECKVIPNGAPNTGRAK